MPEDLAALADRLDSALRAIPGYGSPAHIEGWETWVEPGTQVEREFVLIERPAYQPLVYVQTESRTLSVDVARALGTILNDLPTLLASLPGLA